MHEYNFNIDRWYVVNANNHGKLDAGLFLASPVEITDWYDNYASYVAKCEEINITPMNE